MKTVFQSGKERNHEAGDPYILHYTAFISTYRYTSQTDDFASKNIQSTLVISKSKIPSETLRDIRTSTYQICSIEENTN